MSFYTVGEFNRIKRFFDIINGSLFKSFIVNFKFKLAIL